MISVSWYPGQYYMYENAELVLSGGTSSTYAPSQGNIIRFCGGAYSMGVNADMDGRMAIAQVYNKPLSATQIKQLFNSFRGRFNL
jgi:hypothetical protein